MSFYLALLVFLISYFLLTQSTCVILNLKILAYILLRIHFLLRRFTNFQKRLNSFINFFSSSIPKILEMLQFFQYTKIHDRMENAGMASFYIFLLLAAIITTRLLILKMLLGDESLILIFHLLLKTMVSVYLFLFMFIYHFFYQTKFNHAVYASYDFWYESS